ncbi:MAG TPA: PIG-L family deacetylase [Bryobacteraceae bacterium]|jgi:LmbE family N-acetylglucosaminyl deacetylase|nr:PIG-L family deacetylase [Bryobacteraceae bacterium]
MTRRESVIALATPALAGLVDAQSTSVRKLNVVCVGGHPDDPETGCGATLARYSAAGHNVVIIYLTRGEAGIEGRTHEEAARIRTEEALKACKMLGAQPMFAGQIDGSTEINKARYAAFEPLLSGQHPDVVFTHWPVDTHPDHCAASLLTFQAWRRSHQKYALLYFEVITGEQTQQFNPNFYVDISDSWQKKKEACFAHMSQRPSDFYPYHEQMERFRGLEHRCQRAEAFIVHSQGPLPPLAW